MTDLTVGADGFRRCFWGDSSPELRVYHDKEWGRPVRSDDRVYEKLCLEGFQAGLSWLTILRKRDAFREAFASFDPAIVETFDDTDVARLLDNPGIVRNRAKINATIANARATMELRSEGVSLAGLLWQHRPAVERAPRQFSEVPPTTAESKSLSNELRRRGFSFVGPTTVYAAMQSLGVVDDHLTGCHWRSIVEAQRSKFRAPKLKIR